MRGYPTIRLLSLMVFFPLVLAQGLPAAKDESQWTTEDVLLAETAEEFQISPDGRWAVWVKKQMDKEKGRRVSNLFLSSLTENKEIQLTRGKFTHSSPRWSPDGSVISFLSTRPLPGTKKEDHLEKEQLWLMYPFGGEPWPVTEFKKGVASFLWDDKDPIVAYEWKDRHTIVLAAREDSSLYERKAKESKETSQAVEDGAHEARVRLFLLDVEDKKIKRVTDNDDWIDHLAVSPDGRWAITRHQRSLSFEFDHKIPPELFLTDLETGQMKPAARDRRLVAEAVWAKDSKGFYFSTEYSSHPDYFTATITLLYHYDISSQQVQQVDLAWENGLATGKVRVTDDGFIALLADGVYYKPARYERRGTTWAMKEITGEHTSNIFGWHLGKDGHTLVYDHSTASKPMQWYRAKLNGTNLENVEQLTHLNPSFTQKPIARTEIVHWTGSLNDSVDGVLYYPIHYEEGKRYPLLLIIHGGPSGVDLDGWSLSISRPMPLFTQRDAFILRVNYHGSGNYGLEWVESIGGGNYYDLERVDLENGVDYLIERGLVDPDKLGTMGWSNGSILTTELITRSRRYKAASAGAGDVEWISDWGNVDFGASFDNYYFGAAPYEDPDLYIRKSPYFRLKDVTTPTIIYTGTEDRNVPPSQSWSHFRVMQQVGKAPVKFILFPGEPHGLRKFVHQRRKLQEDLEWFDRYLFGTYEAPNEALKEGSPLDVALKRAQIRKVETRYGIEAKGTLIPELVEYKGLELGCFEVTRAQFAAFDPSWHFEPGTENFPANGISFEQAKAYARWLSELTGETYRLPDEEEVKAVYESARDNENTLDYWAGYPPSPDDTKRLAEKIAKLEGKAPLLRAVGQFQGRGNVQLVFDLGGNVAEWTIGTDGGGKLLGGSADRPADPKASGQQASEAYRGFRIIRRSGQVEVASPLRRMNFPE